MPEVTVARVGNGGFSYPQFLWITLLTRIIKTAGNLALSGLPTE
jgi:hypothetical protein